jgi:hypothetical protein
MPGGAVTASQATRRQTGSFRLPRGGRDNGRRPTSDAPEIVGRQFHPDDGHRDDDQNRYAGLHDCRQQGIPRR